MTWEELVKKAKELGYDTYGVSNFKLQKDTDTKQIAFWDDGTITCEYKPIIYDRTPEQMYQIMLALENSPALNGGGDGNK